MSPNEALVNALVSLVVAIIGFVAYNVSNYVTAKKNESKSNNDQQKWQMLSVIATTAVKMTEQFALTGQIKNDAQEKFDTAMDWVAKEAEKLGIQYDEQQVEGLIESALKDGVHKMGNALVIQNVSTDKGDVNVAAPAATEEPKPAS